MTEKAIQKACRALMRNQTNKGKKWPRVYIVDDSVFFMKRPAQRAKDWLDYLERIQWTLSVNRKQHRIEVLPIEDAWRYDVWSEDGALIHHGRDMDASERKQIDFDADTVGEE